jgi:hypothetical protein
MAALPRREIPLLIAAFLFGLLASGALAAGWFMTITSSRSATPLIVMDSMQVQERSGGEISIAHQGIVDRLAAARVPSTPIRGGLGIRASQLVWTDGPRRAFARVPNATGVLDIRGVTRGDIILDQVVVSDGTVLLDQPQTGGEWNYERVLAELLADDEPRGPRRTIRLTNVTVRDSRVEIHQEARDIALENLAADLARIEMSSPHIEEPIIEARTMTGTYADLRKNQRLAVRAEDGVVTLPKKRMDFRVERATLGSTQFANLEGTWAPGTGGLGLTLSGRANDVALEELAWMSERLPRSGRGSFNFAMRPGQGDILEIRLTNADIRAEGSHIRGAVSLQVAPKHFELLAVDARLEPLAMRLVEQMMGRKLPYSGTVTGTVRGTGAALAFDVTTNLVADSAGQRINTRIEGRARLTGGFALQNLTADLRDVPGSALRAFMPNLPLGGTITGTIALTGPPERAPLSLNVRLDVGGGVALVNGTLDLTRAQPSYDLTGRLIGVNLDQLIDPPAPPAAITARFNVRGQGFAPESADVRLGLAGRFTGWHAQPHDTLLIAATVRGGTITVDTGVVFLGPVHLQTRGQWRFVAPESGALDYDLVVENLAQIASFIPALPDSAGGALEGSGKISGSLARMRIEGELQAEELHVTRWEAHSLHAKHVVVLGGPVPEIDIDVGARGISTPTTGAYSAASVKLKLSQPTFALEARADRVEGGVIEIAADGNIPYEGARRVVVQRVNMDLGGSKWALAAPAVIDWGGAGSAVNVTNLELRDAGVRTGRLRIDGRILPLAQIDVRVETAALPLAEVQRLIGREPRIEGLLYANADVRGPGTSPTFEIDFRVDSGSIEGVGFRRVEGELNYTGQSLIANALATFDTAGKLDVRAALPMTVVLDPKLKLDLLDAGTVRGSLVADSVKLATFASVFPDLRDVQGVLRANAQLTGTVATPELSGSISAAGGAVTIVPLNKRYTDLSADIVFDRRSAEIRSIKARSDGEAEITGRIDFPKISEPEADINVMLAQFRAAGVENHDDAAATGVLRIRGDLFGPTISGAVTLADGDVPVPIVGSNPLDAELAELGDPGDLPDPLARPAEPAFFDKVKFDDLRLIAGEGLWFSMENARAQLVGELRINKTGNDMRIVGMLEGDRGTYTLEAGPILRRFEVVHAQVRFLGNPEINPALDITARRVIMQPDREIEVRVNIAGTLRTPTLSLSSADAANIPQSELLSFLLFGQGTLGLSGALPGQALLQETILGGLTELATMQFLEISPFDFDIFQVRLGGSGFEGLFSPTLVVGKEIRSDVFLTLETGIEGILGDQRQTGTQGATATGAVRLEWRMDPRTSLRVGYETANRRRLARGLGVALPVTRQHPQATVELRRRWSW